MATLYFTNNADSGDGSLRATMLSSSVGDVIQPDPESFPVGDVVITLNSYLPLTNTSTSTALNCTIESSNGRHIVIDCQYDAYPIYCNIASVDITFNDVEFTRCYKSDSGCFDIAKNSAFTFNRCVFHDNRAYYGLFFVRSTYAGTLTLSNCIAYRCNCANRFTSSGGGVIHFSGTGNVILSGCTFVNAQQVNISTGAVLGIASETYWAESKDTLVTIKDCLRDRYRVGTNTTEVDCTNADFVDASNDDYRLAYGSKFLSGATELVGTTDFYGHTRRTNGALGAYEGSWYVLKEGVYNSTQICDYLGVPFTTSTSINFADDAFISILEEVCFTDASIALDLTGYGYIASTSNVDLTRISSSTGTIKFCPYGAEVADLFISEGNLTWTNVNSTSVTLESRASSELWTTEYTGTLESFKGAIAVKYRLFNGIEFIYFNEIIYVNAGPTLDASMFISALERACENDVLTLTDDIPITDAVELDLSNYTVNLDYGVTIDLFSSRTSYSEDDLHIYKLQLNFGGTDSNVVLGSGTFVFKDCEFVGSDSTTGSVISSTTASSITFERCLIAGNRGTSYAVYAPNSEVTFECSLLYGNVNSTNAVSFNADSVVMNASTIVGNCIANTASGQYSFLLGTHSFTSDSATYVSKSVGSWLAIYPNTESEVISEWTSSKWQEYNVHINARNTTSTVYTQSDLVDYEGYTRVNSVYGAYAKRCYGIKDGESVSVWTQSTYDLIDLRAGTLTLGKDVIFACKLLANVSNTTIRSLNNYTRAYFATPRYTDLTTATFKNVGLPEYTAGVSNFVYSNGRYSWTAENTQLQVCIDRSEDGITWTEHLTLSETRSFRPTLTGYYRIVDGAHYIDKKRAVVFTSTSDSGAGSLREAISTVVDGDVVEPDASIVNDNNVTAVELTTALALPNCTFTLGNNDVLLKLSVLETLTSSANTSFTFNRVSYESSNTLDVLSACFNRCYVKCGAMDVQGSVEFNNSVYTGSGIDVGVDCVFRCIDSTLCANNSDVSTIVFNGQLSSYDVENSIIPNVVNGEYAGIANTTIESAKFVSYSTGDLRLSPDSPYLTGGTPVNTIDYLGNLRTTAIGAYEHSWIVLDDSIALQTNNQIATAILNADYIEFNSDVVTLTGELDETENGDVIPHAIGSCALIPAIGYIFNEGIDSVGFQQSDEGFAKAGYRIYVKGESDSRFNALGSLTTIEFYTECSNLLDVTVTNQTKNQALITLSKASDDVLTYYDSAYTNSSGEEVSTSSSTLDNAVVNTDIKTNEDSYYLFFDGETYYRVIPTRYVILAKPTNLTATTTHIEWDSDDSEGIVVLYAYNEFNESWDKLTSEISGTEYSLGLISDLRIKLVDQGNNEVETTVVESESDVVYVTSNSDSGDGTLSDVLEDIQAGAIIKLDASLVASNPTLTLATCNKTFTIDGEDSLTIEIPDVAHFTGMNKFRNCIISPVGTDSTTTNYELTGNCILERCRLNYNEDANLYVAGNTWCKVKACLIKASLNLIDRALFVRSTCVGSTFLYNERGASSGVYFVDTTLYKTSDNDVSDFVDVYNVVITNGDGFINADNDYRLNSTSSQLSGANSLVGERDLYGNPFVKNGALGCYEGSWLVGVEDLAVTDNNANAVDYLELESEVQITFAEDSTLTVHKKAYVDSTNTLVCNSGRAYFTVGDMSYDVQTIGDVIRSQYGAGLLNASCESGMLTITKQNQDVSVLLEYLNGDNWTTLDAEESDVSVTLENEGIYRVYDGERFITVQTYTGSWYITTDADSGQGSLRWILKYAPDGVSIVYDVSKNTGENEDAMTGKINLSSPITMTKTCTFAGYGNTGFGANGTDSLVIGSTVTFGGTSNEGGLLVNANITFEQIKILKGTPVFGASNNAKITIEKTLTNDGTFALDSRFTTGDECNLTNNGVMTLTYDSEETLNSVVNNGTLAIASSKATTVKSFVNNGVTTLTSEKGISVDTLVNNGTFACASSGSLAFNDVTNQDGSYLQLHRDNNGASVLAYHK